MAPSAIGEEFQRGHFEDTASGHCARPAALLLEAAYYLGDKQALEAGLKTLQYMKRFCVPRGAQTWELSLHTPDILASAELVRAYVRGYELTGNEDYLAEARRWALFRHTLRLPVGGISGDGLCDHSRLRSHPLACPELDGTACAVVRLSVRLRDQFAGPI